MLNHKSIVIFTILAFMFSGIGHAAAKKPKTKSKIQQKRLKINPMTDYQGAWVANIETDVYRTGTFENMTAGYSAHNGWDFSLSLLNTQILGNDNRFQGLTFINIAKTFEVTNDFSIVAGMQNGIALTNVQPQQWLNFTFLDYRYDLAPWLSIHTGSYLANAAITGTSRQVGFMAGSEITFIENKLSLQLDYISGHHSVSGATVNMLFNITPRCQIYMGVLVPEQNSGNEFAGLIGLNFSTHHL